MSESVVLIGACFRRVEKRGDLAIDPFEPGSGEQITSMSRPKYLPGNFTLALIVAVVAASVLPCRDVSNVLEEIAVGDVQARSKQGGDDA